MQAVTIYYKGLELEVTGHYEEGERDTWEHAGYASTFEVEDIALDGHSLYELLHDKLSEIEQLVIEKIEG